MSISSLSFKVAGNWTQAPEHGRQVLYHWATHPRPLFFLHISFSISVAPSLALGWAKHGFDCQAILLWPISAEVRPHFHFLDSKTWFFFKHGVHLSTITFSGMLAASFLILRFLVSFDKLVSGIWVQRHYPTHFNSLVLTQKPSFITIPMLSCCFNEHWHLQLFLMAHLTWN